ncbi:hypothetical protein E8L99_09055 [Phreatobacter aquaticus]|uniref:Uncharacterized protein n=1 Tax=Phreatobacter aquaticus TaxID=2570229 RepID=A0A4D7QJK2_9HYPH|nr:hypothetical protein [Phreatobacter aquaticus]QCK85899.1 hypothetical protein E8L99_09055 [Phreatobacter aquaticus]
MKRSDPVGPEFYVPLTSAESFSDAAFYLAAALSVAVLFVDRAANLRAYDLVQGAFALSVICHFLSGIVIKVYFSARAHAARVADFVSNAFLVPLTATPSEGYYNTPSGDAFVRLGASVLENALFTKRIVARMLCFERWRISLYLFVWISAVLYRATDLAIVAVAAQVLFSEQLLSRFVRMEWLRLRVEKVHDDLFRLFQGSADRESKEFRARVIQAMVLYETSKAQAAISLSSRLFEKLNGELSRSWENTRTQLGLAGPTGGDP